MPLTAEKLRDEALRLPQTERARLAADLLESLEDTEEAVEAAWAAEIEKRVAAIRAGEVGSTDWRVVLAEVEREVLGR
ncbi:MAG TPA: addiction module protein [Thermoanaerobaculia bacterium]|jgi:putative addiction module component (TIGR02574 family)|nr:addiction module protein [Thermoanaerobaculia bacterium]